MIANALRRIVLATALLLSSIALIQNAQASQFVQGSKSAAVQIVIFGDLQCPFCAKLWTYMDQFKADYGDKIGITYTHFPLSFHAQAMPAAINAECAAQQGKFPQFIAEIYKDQSQMGQKRYFEIAADVGITDRMAFVTCVSNPATRALIDADISVGKSFNVHGTPEMYINGKEFFGVYEYSSYKNEIDSDLAAAAPTH